jgi:hypothetical protein
VGYSITPITALGGVLGTKTITELVAGENTPHTTWVERLRLATDFITPDNSLICVADKWLHEDVVNVTPIGIAQSFGYSEALAAMLAPEIGSRRKRAIVGSSQGGSVNISKMVCMGVSPLAILAQNGSAMGINPDHWTEKEWTAMIGLNNDRLRTPIGLVVIEGAPDGRNYSAYMFEQCLMQGQSRGFQAGQHLVVDNFQLIYEQIVPLWGVSAEEGVDYGSTI